MKIVFLDAGTLGGDIDLSGITSMGEAVLYDASAPEETRERLRDAGMVVVNKCKLNAETLAEAKSLKIICEAATGYDNIDIGFCREHGIAVCNVPGYSTPSVAQLTLSMVLSLATHLPQFSEYVNSGEYTKSGMANHLTPVYHEISGMTWGVVGGGAIGSKVAEIAKAFGCRVVMCRRKKDDRYEQADIDTLCRISDIITLHVPGSPETKGMISRERIASMKKNAIIVNVSRGVVCDEAALADAILEGRLGGLGVDVYTKEPFPSDHPFTKLLGRDDVCLTPHMAWGSFEARTRCMNTIRENALAFFEGRELNRIV